jgi:hypothetical protein
MTNWFKTRKHIKEVVKMKINNLFKILFDLVMLVLLAGIYCVHSTGMAFHEYAGLAIFVFFIIHLMYNYKWIVNAGKKLFANSISVRIKIMYTVDLLLLISFILIGISGIMISHIVFKLEKMPLWRPVHSISSASALILLALHIGLHGKMIANTIKSKIKAPFAVIKIGSALVFTAMLCTGIYGDIVLKLKSIKNETEGQPRYETVVSLFKQSIMLLINPPEHIKDGEVLREAGDGGKFFEHNGGKIIADHDRDFDGPPPKQRFNAISLWVSVSNYISIIVFFSIIVYIIDNKIKKRMCKKSQKLYEK